MTTVKLFAPEEAVLVIIVWIIGISILGLLLLLFDKRKGRRIKNERDSIKR